MILLFQKTSQRFYYFWQNEKTILLFGVGRGYEFTDRQKESGGTGVISSDAAFFVLTVNLAIFLTDSLGFGDQLVNARLGDLQLCGDFPDGISL